MGVFDWLKSFLQLTIQLDRIERRQIQMSLDFEQVKAKIQEVSASVDSGFQAVGDAITTGFAGVAKEVEETKTLVQNLINSGGVESPAVQEGLQSVFDGLGGIGTKITSTAKSAADAITAAAASAAKSLDDIQNPPSTEPPPEEPPAEPTFS